MTYACLRESTDKQDLEKNKPAVLQLASREGIKPVHFVEEKVSGTKDWKERGLGELFDTQLQDGDFLIVPEISRIGRTAFQIHEVASVARERGITLYAIKQNLKISADKRNLTTTIMLSTFAMMAEIERDLISQRTKEALRIRKENGVRLGRKPGQKVRSKLDEYRDEILTNLRGGMSKKQIAKTYNTSTVNLYKWLKSRRLYKYSQSDYSRSEHS